MKNLPFEDEIFDFVISNFEHMFAPNPQVVIKTIIRFTKPGGCVAFSTGPFELANGKLFKALANYLLQLQVLNHAVIHHKINNKYCHLQCNGQIQK